MRFRLSMCVISALLFMISSPVQSQDEDYNPVQALSEDYRQDYNYIARAKGNKQGNKHRTETNPSLFKIQEAINPAFYVGFGWSIGTPLSLRSKSRSGIEIATLRDVNTTSIKQNSPEMSLLGFFGYQLNQIVSFEVFYRETISKSKTTIKETFDVDTLNLGHVGVTWAQFIEFGPRTLVALPISRFFSPYLLLGLVAGYDKIKTRAPGHSTSSEQSWAISYGHGYGLRFQFTKNIGLRLDTFLVGFNAVTSTSSALVTYSF